MLLLSCKWTLESLNCALDPLPQALLSLQSLLPRPLHRLTQLHPRGRTPACPRYRSLSQPRVPRRRRRFRILLFDSDHQSYPPLYLVRRSYVRERPPPRRGSPFCPSGTQRASPCVKRRQAMKAPRLILPPVSTLFPTPGLPRPFPYLQKKITLSSAFIMASSALTA